MKQFTDIHNRTVYLDLRMVSSVAEYKAERTVAKVNPETGKEEKLTSRDLNCVEIVCGLVHFYVRGEVTGIVKGVEVWKSPSV